MDKKTTKISKRKAKPTRNLMVKPPVVVVLGHIDHGKTSLLSAIRKIQVTSGKPGGVITQHIGDYHVEKEGKKITFLDTPGHESFSAMRARGAKVADIAILVIDAAEGVKEQTKEAILHIKKAQIPMIVALNKIDRPGANPEKVKGGLAKENILVESLGGKIPSIETSAMTGQGIEELLELILLVAEMENLKFDVSKPVQGTIIESYSDSKRGPIATLILEEGILKLGDIIATQSAVGKVKHLEDFQGEIIKEALPGQPAVIIGFTEVPRVGENFGTFLDFETAKQNLKVKEKKKPETFKIEPGKKVLNLILKTDVLGSIEALEEVLKELPKEKVVLRILKSEVGEINESDVKLAKSGKALILGFRVKTNSVVRNFAQKEGVKIINFEVIYDLIEGVRKSMEKSLEMEVIRTDLGKIKVLVNFWSEKNRQIVGGKIIEGRVEKGTLIEVSREEKIIDQGRMISLQKNKKEIEKAVKGEEVGILYEGKKRIEKGDILTIFKKERKKVEL